MFGHVISQKTWNFKDWPYLSYFKDRDFWFGPKNCIKLCAEHFTTLGVTRYISVHVTGINTFLIEKWQYL